MILKGSIPYIGFQHPATIQSVSNHYYTIAIYGIRSLILLHRTLSTLWQNRFITLAERRWIPYRKANYVWRHSLYRSYICLKFQCCKLLHFHQYVLNYDTAYNILSWQMCCLLYLRLMGNWPILTAQRTVFDAYYIVHCVVVIPNNLIQNIYMFIQIYTYSWSRIHNPFLQILSCIRVLPTCIKSEYILQFIAYGRIMSIISIKGTGSWPESIHNTFLRTVKLDTSLDGFRDMPSLFAEFSQI